MSAVDYTAYLQGSLTLTKSGEWIHEGKPFENRKVIDLFSRSTVWDESLKQFVVRIGRQQATFRCEDTGFFVLALRTPETSPLVLLSDGSEEPLNKETLRIGDTSQFYAIVKQGKFRARFLRGAHQVLLQQCSADGKLTLAGTTFDPARLSEDLP